jgi:hypothetical protein
MNIARQTLAEWEKSNKKIADALRKGREVVDCEVENSLLKKCLGYDVSETKAFKCREIFYDGDGNKCEKEVLKTVKIFRHVDADTLAAIAWLNNRLPEKWRRNAGKEILDAEKFKHKKKVDATVIF